MLDLHLHSNYSDGHLNTDEIIKLLEQIQMTGFSITDHDELKSITTVNEWIENNNNQLYYIPGIEYGLTYKNREVHILAYFVDYNSNEIIEMTNYLQDDRNLRILKIIEKLQIMGLEIDLEEVKSLAAGTIISRSHIAQILLNKGYCNSIPNAFEKYLGPKQSAYVSKEAISIEELIQMIKRNEGVAILAHPKTVYNDNYVEEIINKGIDGLEIVNSKHQYEDVLRYYEMAEKYHILKTCGSDCHGKEYNGKMLLGEYAMNFHMVKPMIQLHQLRKKG